MKKLLLVAILLISTLKTQSQTPLFEGILRTFVNNDGNVDYKGLRKNKALLNIYLNDLNKVVPGKKWSSNKAKAFWINVYNAYSIKLILESYPLKEITAIKRKGQNAWKIPIAKVGGQTYSLDYIEHKILRRWHDDPRIHVGLNSASKSGPRFVNFMFTEKNVDSKLEDLMNSFINDPTKNKISSTKLEISKVFEWYKEDFTYKTTLIEYLNKYSSTKVSNNTEITFKEHNWALNDQFLNK